MTGDTAARQASPHQFSRPTRLTALLLGAVLMMLGNGLQGTLLGVRAGVEGMAEETVGLMMSGYFLGYVGFSWLAPRLIEAVGHIRAFAAMASIASSVSLMHAIFVAPLPWIVLRTLHGACYAGMVVVAESWLNATTQRRQRGRVLALYGVLVNGAWGASQALLVVAPPEGFVLFALVSILLSFALVPITLTRAGTPGVVRAKRLPLARLYEISPLGLGGAFAAGLVISALWGMGPTFAHSIGLSDAGISAFMGLTMAGTLMLQWPLGRLSDAIDRRRVMAATSLGAGAAALALAWGADGHGAMLMALAFLFGGLAVPGYSLSMAHVNDHIGEDEVVPATSALIMVFGAGAAIGPFAAALLMGRLGPQALFLYAAAVEAAFLAFALYRMTRSAPVAPEEKEAFVAMPQQTSHAATPMQQPAAGAAPGARAPE